MKVHLITFSPNSSFFTTSFSCNVIRRYLNYIHSDSKIDGFSTVVKIIEDTFRYVHVSFRIGISVELVTLQNFVKLLASDFHFKTNARPHKYCCSLKQPY